MLKVTHISLSGPVTDGFSYQDNLLPKYHKKIGYDVSMITSKYIWNSEGKVTKDNRDEYINEYGIKTIRLNNKFNSNINSKFKIYKGLYEAISYENPEVLFIHGVQFLDIYTIIRYLERFPNVKAYVDNHADFSNSATNWISKNVLHKSIWRRCAQSIEPYVEKFYGVLPARVDFLNEIYRIPKEKIELLVMGADDEKVEEFSSKAVKKETRKIYGIEETDFLIVTGGKIDYAKIQVLNLMKSIAGAANSNLKLIVYGSVIEELKKEIEILTDSKSIDHIGWIDDDLSYKLFAAADLIVFPGRHSVYWEQAVAMGKPLVVKYWDGTTHIDIGGNCMFLYQDTFETLNNVINAIVSDPNKYEEMLDNAQKNEKNNFLYSRIALKSLT